LFNLNNAKLVSCGLCTVSGISHEFSTQTNIYDVTADGIEIQRASSQPDPAAQTTIARKARATTPEQPETRQAAA
jgi:hypothetical protein